MGRHHRDKECYPCEPVRPAGPGGIFGGLFGGESTWIWIILLFVFFCCFCNKDGSGINLGDAPMKLLDTFMKSRAPAT